MDLPFLKGRLETLKARVAATGAESCKQNSFRHVKTGMAKETEQSEAGYLGLFTGAAGLNRAVQARGARVLAVPDTQVAGKLGNCFDLLDLSVFRSLKLLVREGKVRWLHAAFPRRTFSKARSSGHSAKAKQLRTARRPQGVAPRPRQVVEANLLAARTAQLARAQRRAGGWFSVEGPATSLLWSYPPFQSLLRLTGVKQLKCDQCCFAGEHRNSTKWLTNAAFLQVLARDCPGSPEHQHGRLQARQDPALTAEYPQGLCEVVAESYCKALVQEPHNCPKGTEPWRDEEARAPEGSRKRQRERENQDCIGGLRAARRSVQKVPGWKTVGLAVRQCLDQVLLENPNMLQIVQSIGQDQPVYSDADVRLVQSKLASLLNLKDIPREPGLWSELLQALVLASGDPDLPAAKWPIEGTPLGVEEEIPCQWCVPSCACRGATW